MRLSKILACAFTLTAIALCWVHQQISLVTTSYEIAKKEDQLSELILVRSQLEYRVLTLESPNQLDQRLHQVDRGLSFVDPLHIVKMEKVDTKEIQAKEIARRSSSIWEFLVRTVEARSTEDHK